MRRKRSTPSGRFRASTLPACAAAVVCFLSASRAAAQDVAEAARQERARKASESSLERHVYTNEDLKRSRILTPKDRATFEARQTNSAPVPNPRQESPDAANRSWQSLGEVARRYRQEKESRAAQLSQGKKNQQRSAYPLDLPRTSHAAPNPMSLPPLVSSKPLAQPAPRTRAAAPILPSRRDPFARPRFTPELRAAAVPSESPKISSRRALPPSFTISPTVAPAPPASARVPSSPANQRQSAEAAPKFPGNAQQASSTRTLASTARSVEPRVAVPPPIPHAPASSLPPVAPPKFVGSNNIVTRPGDSLWALSRRYLGAGSRWQEWLGANPAIANPNRLHPGMTLTLPATASAREPATVSVQKGDTLWSIAKAHFGNGADWTCLAQANPTLPNVDLLYPGQVLLVPASCGERP